METIILVIHILIATGLVAAVLLQRSEGGALGIGGGGGLMTSRGAGDLLTRTTAVLAALFFASSIALALMAGRDSETRPMIEDVAPPPAPTQPAAPQSPTVPLSQ